MWLWWNCHLSKELYIAIMKVREGSSMTWNHLGRNKLLKTTNKGGTEWHKRMQVQTRTPWPTSARVVAQGRSWKKSVAWEIGLRWPEKSPKWPKLKWPKLFLGGRRISQVAQNAGPVREKTWLVVKEEHYVAASAIFAGSGIQLTGFGRQYSGSAIGSAEFSEAFVKMKVEGWVYEIEQLSLIAKTHPHAAYAAYTHGLGRK